MSPCFPNSKRGASLKKTRSSPWCRTGEPRTPPNPQRIPEASYAVLNCFVGIDIGGTVDTVIAAMEANHPHLTTQKTFYVEISRAATVPSSSPTTGTRSANGSKPPPASGSRRSKRSSPNRRRRRNPGWRRSAALIGRVPHPASGHPSPELEKTPEPRRIEHDLEV